MPFGIIYKVENKVNGKVYIGQTVQSLNRRRQGHYFDVKHNRDRSILHKALKKYKKSDFEWEIIEKCISKEELNEMEFHYIKQYKSYDDGYNSTFGGEGSLGNKHNEETRTKMSKSRSGKLNSFYGKKHSEETKILMRKNHKGFTGRKHKPKTIEIMKKNNSKAMKDILGDKNKCSRKYVIITPEGEELIIKGLNYFCERNGLTTTNMSKCANGKLNSHKGYKCRHFNGENK